MLEYVFFDRGPCERFQAYLQERRIPCMSEEGDIERVVLVEDALVTDNLADEIDVVYDRMLGLDEASEDVYAGPEKRLDSCGVLVRLRSGETAFAGVKPEVMRKLLQALTLDELGELISVIADVVESPGREVW